MTHRAASIICMIALLALHGRANQNKSKPSMEISNVEMIELVSVDVTIPSPTESLYLPSCELWTGGTSDPCDRAIQVQTERPGGWRPLQLKHSESATESVSSSTPTQIIAAGTNVTYPFRFRKTDFILNRGQRLRVILSAWHDKDSMNNKSADLEIVSAPFDCP